LEIVVFGAERCHKCRDIVKIMTQSNLRCTGILLKDSPEDLARLQEETGSIYVPAIKIGGRVVLGYFPRQLSILLGCPFKARDHTHHRLR